MITISNLLLTFLLNAFWQMVLITAAAAICARLLGRLPARYRYMLWVTALSLSLLLPVLTSSLPLREFFYDVTPPVAGRQPFIYQGTTLLNSLEPAKMNPEAAPFTIPVGMNLAAALIILYSLFVLYRGRKLIKAWSKTRDIMQGAYQVPLSDSIEKAIEKCRAVIDVKKVSVLCSAAVSVPITIGNRNPVIILPEQLMEETDSNILTTAIGHELVHIRRRDYIFNLIFEIVYLPLSFHPAAALVKRRISQTREFCCDETVAKRLLKADVYARSLVKIAGSASNLIRPAATITVGITDAENLEVRIMSLLKKSELSLYRKSLLITAVLLLLAIPCVVAAFFVLNPAINVSAQQIERQDAKQSNEERELVERKLKMEQELKERQNESPEMKLHREQEEKEMMRLKMEKAIAERQEQARLARAAKITMDQAIQKATEYQSGIALSSILGYANGEVVYKVFILDKDSTEGNVTLVIVSGIDGRVIKTEKELMRREVPNPQ